MVADPFRRAEPPRSKSRSQLKLTRFARLRCQWWKFSRKGSALLCTRLSLCPVIPNRASVRKFYTTVFLPKKHNVYRKSKCRPGGVFLSSRTYSSLFCTVCFNRLFSSWTSEAIHVERGFSFINRDFVVQNVGVESEQLSMLIVLSSATLLVLFLIIRNYGTV